MWKQPWGYIEGWIICAGLLITGMIIQQISGEIDPEAFCFPVNLIFGAMFLLCLFIFHLCSAKNMFFQWFSGLPAGITSLTSLLFLLMIMGFTNICVSWAFLLLSFYFLWILGLVVLRRLSRFQWKDTGFILNHAGLFIFFFAAILGSSDLQRLRMTVPLNDPEWRATNGKNEMVELPLAIELHDFIIDEYPPKLMLLEHSNDKAPFSKKLESITVENCPSVAKLSDWTLEIVEYLPSAAAIINKDTVNFVEYDAEGACSALYVKVQHLTDNDPKEGWISCGNYLFPQVSLKLTENLSLVMPDREPKCFTSDVTVYTKDGEMKQALIEVNKPLSVAGWKIYQLNYDTVKGKWSSYSVFELVKDPWLPVVYLGIVMLLAGSIFLFVSAPKKTD